MLVWDMWYIHTVLQPSLLPSTSIRDYLNAWRPLQPFCSCPGLSCKLLMPSPHTFTKSCPFPNPLPCFPSSDPLPPSLSASVWVLAVSSSPGALYPRVHDPCLPRLIMLSLNYKPDVFPVSTSVTAHITYRVSSSVFCQGNKVPFPGRIL